jgi:hypothetical protein
MHNYTNADRTERKLCRLTRQVNHRTRLAKMCRLWGIQPGWITSNATRNFMPNSVQSLERVLDLARGMTLKAGSSRGRTFERLQSRSLDLFHAINTFLWSPPFSGFFSRDRLWIRPHITYMTGPSTISHCTTLGPEDFEMRNGILQNAGLIPH